MTIWPDIHVKTPDVCDSHRKSPRLKNANSAGLLLAYVSHWCQQCVAYSFTASLIHPLGAVPKSIAIRPPKTERKPDFFSLMQSFSTLNLWKAYNSYNSFCFGVLAVQNEYKKKDVYSCEACIHFVCHHLSHKDVNFVAK